MINKLKIVWRYIKCVLILKLEIGYRKKKKFKYFGKSSSICLPIKLHSGTKNIEIGDNTTVLSYSRMQTYSDQSGHGSIAIGRNCYIGFNFTVLSGPNSEVIIEDDVLIASDVIITNENHGINPEINIPYMNQELTTNSVFIDQGSWIGEKVCILAGVHIGKKSIIGASSVVTHDIPDYSIAVGNPARVIKQYNFFTHQWERNLG